MQTRTFLKHFDRYAIWKSERDDDTMTAVSVIEEILLLSETRPEICWNAYRYMVKPDENTNVAEAIFSFLSSGGDEEDVAEEN